MATFEVKVVEIDDIEPIENADAIELARIADYRSVVKKGQFQKGDLAVYIPEASVVPDDLLEVMGLTGKLAGSSKNRVKAIRLRGQLSQGLLYPVWFDNMAVNGCVPSMRLLCDFERQEDGTLEATHAKEVEVGQDVAEDLGITKYEPPIPTTMSGEVCRVGIEHALKYDIENIKKYPDVLIKGEEVVVMEKLHGTCCILAINADIDHPDLPDKSWIISKGLSAQGLAFKDNENNKGNVYFRALETLRPEILNAFKDKGQMYIIGEVFGSGVQDLQYGCVQNEVKFRAFDIYMGTPSNGRYVNFDEFLELCDDLIETVPVLYRGAYDKKLVEQLTDGFSAFDATQIKEGVVTKPVEERQDDAIGRVILKSVSGDYLTRKGGTEYT